MLYRDMRNPRPLMYAAGGYALGAIATYLLVYLLFGAEAGRSRDVIGVVAMSAGIFGFVVGRWWTLLFPIIWPGSDLLPELTGKVHIVSDDPTALSGIEALVVIVCATGLGWLLRVYTGQLVARAKARHPE